jgi:hypothetical protein
MPLGDVAPITYSRERKEAARFVCGSCQRLWMPYAFAPALDDEGLQIAYYDCKGCERKWTVRWDPSELPAEKGAA